MLSQHQQIFEQIKKAKNILIAFSANWNGDNIASALAFYLFLKKIGKKAEIISSKSEAGTAMEIKSKAFSFLPAFAEIKRIARDLNRFVISLSTTHAQIKGVKFRQENGTAKFIITPQKGNFSAEDVKIETESIKYDLIIVLDTPDMESLGKLFSENRQFFYATPIINIDHHSSNEEYGQINLVQINAVATSEIIFSLLSSDEGNPVDADIATCLLTGIISKTKNFKTANVTPDTLAATSSLISREARREEIVNQLYRSRGIGVLKLWGIILSRLTYAKNGQIIWSAVTNNDFIKTDTSKSDLNDIVDELIANIPEAKVIIIFYEIADAAGNLTVNFLVHSPKNINVLDLTRDYNPKGDEKMVEIETKKKLEEIKEEIIELIDKKINQYSS
ncbi:MAG TPA: DHH family phosphoesterase [Candidatus Methylomirabilis sp.]|nr:DHH family phosphoesterase [Candidatus Methylomirabilis sp.]